MLQQMYFLYHRPFTNIFKVEYLFFFCFGFYIQAKVQVTIKEAERPSLQGLPKRDFPQLQV